MIGFYLTVNKSANSHVKLLLRRCGSPTDWDALEQKGLHIFDDDRSQIDQSNGYAIFNIGTLIYKNVWHNKALECVASELNNGKALREIMPNTRGQFCLVVYTGRNVFVITDKLGSFPIYMFEDNDIIQISNVLLLLAKNNNVSIDHQAFAEYLSFDYCFDSTFFNEIKRLSTATIYQFGEEGKTQLYDNVFSDIHFNKYTDLNKIAGMAKEILVHNLSFLSLDDNLFVDITGGFDTRTVATLLQSKNIDFEAGNCGEQILKESELAETVAQALGVKFHSGIKITDRNMFKKILDQHFMINTGVPILYHSTELINYYERIRREFDIHVTGFGGTELTTQDLPKLNLLSSRINKKSLFQKNFIYSDIFVNGFSTKAQYYDQLAKKIDSLLLKIGSDLHNEVANFLRFSSVSRYYHGCLIGTHNTIMPFYSPFLERNYVKLMMETSYNLKSCHKIQRAILTELDPSVSLIMTSHRYSADMGSKKADNAFERSKKYAKDLARQMIYQFGFSVKVMRLIESFARKLKAPVDMAELQRSFWVSEINEMWSDDMAIFEVIDRKKMNNCFTNRQGVSKLRAKILYLNRIVEKCKVKL